MKKNIVFCAGLLLLCSSFLWANGQSEQPQGAATPAQKTTLQFWTRLGATPDEVNAIVGEWNTANPNVNIVVQNIPGDQYRTKLLTSVAGGNAPDVVGLDVAIMPQYMGQDALLPLDSYIGAEGAGFHSDFGPGMWQGAASGGKTYGVFWWSDPSALLYNKTLFSNAGLTPPQTWDELLSSADRLTKQSSNPNEQVYGAIMPVVGPWVMWVWLPYLWSAGAHLLDANDCAAFNNAAGVSAMQLWVEIYKHGDMPRSAVFSKDTQAIDSAFYSGRVAMYTQGAGMIRQAAKVAPTLELGVVPMPAARGGTRSSYLGGDYLVIMKSTKNAADAWKFITFAVDAKRMSSLAASNNGVWIDGLMVRSSALTPEFAQKYPYQQGFIDAERVGQVPTTKWLSEIRVPIWNGFQAALAGETTVEQAVADAAAKVNQITGCKK